MMCCEPIRWAFKRPDRIQRRIVSGFLPARFAASGTVIMARHYNNPGRRRESGSSGSASGVAAGCHTHRSARRNHRSVATAADLHPRHCFRSRAPSSKAYDSRPSTGWLRTYQRLSPKMGRFEAACPQRLHRAREGEGRGVSPARAATPTRPRARLECRARRPPTCPLRPHRSPVRSAIRTRPSERSDETPRTRCGRRR